MKAITLWQPYASLVAIGAKPHETRSWGTGYRGPIAIHAGLKPAHELDGITSEAICMAFDWLYEPYKTDISSHIRALPHGAVVATAMLAECWQVIKHTATAVVLRQSNGVGEDKIPIDDPYLMFGDYSIGRYIWALTDIRALPIPIPVKGKQGLWNWDAVTVKKHGSMGKSEFSTFEFMRRS